MKKRIIIIISAVLIICALACCITEKRIVMEIVPKSSIPSDLVKTHAAELNTYVNGRKTLTEDEQNALVTMCSKDMQITVLDKLKDEYDPHISLQEKAVFFDSKGNLSVCYYFGYTVCDCENQYKNTSNSPGRSVVKVTFKRESIILSAIFG